MARVVVTGGSGKLGDAVVADLLDNGYEVVNVDLVPSPNERAPFIRVDLTDYGQTIEVLTAIDSRYEGVDAVVHLAAIPGPGAAPNATIFENNVISTYNVFAAARSVGVRNIVWASSETLLGLPFDTLPPYIPVDEEYPARPETAYALSKHLGEQMAIQMCRQDPALKIIGLRFSNVMRPSDYRDFPSYQDDARLRRWNLWGYIDARDGAQAVRKALACRSTGFEAFIIANADTVMVRSSASLAAEIYPDVEIRKELGEHETMLSIDKARRLLGYEPEHGWRDA
ncbi:MAG TPA: NAD(P)-dependent oxidoreductase [Micromonosporaceae bacterium]